MLDKNSNKEVRKKVANRFCNIVQNAAVLDFGGGTGLDLKWLAENNNRIFFCEPSKAMKEIAISSHKNLSNKNVTFLNDSAADFRQWHLLLPFAEKVDAALSNFSVFNCIPDIELLFQNLALVMKPGGNMIALVLTKKTANGNFRNILKSFINHKPASINISYQKYQQTVYIHSIKEII